jgi:AraC-like DNA-binding protein
MRRYVQHEPFNIYTFEADTWEHPVHKHTYFEIIFIEKGKGVHTINDNSFDYQKGDVFLLGPEDYHEFQIRSRTAFYYIRFQDTFLTKSNPQDKQWQQTLGILLQSTFQSKGSILQDKAERIRLEQLLSVLKSEYDQRRHVEFEVMRDSLMKAVMTILSRNIVKQALPIRKAIHNTSLEEIFQYIRQHIYEPERLRVEELSRHFNYAPTYLSIFFKKHTGESLKQYIDHYKVKLIETRLLYSHATLSQIADEFGFTDESHLTKQFKRYNGSSPGDFRINSGLR